MATRTLPAQLDELLIRHEGLKLTPYRCPAGKWTIGVGRNLESPGLSAAEVEMLTHGRSRHPYRYDGDFVLGDVVGTSRDLAQGITRAEALALLANDIARVELELRAYLPYFDELSDNRKMALADMCFNLGAQRFLAFRHMHHQLAAGNWQRAAAEMEDSLWFRQVGARAERLKKMILEG